MLTKTIHTARKFPIPVITYYLIIYSWSTPYSSDRCSWAYGFLRGGNLGEQYIPSSPQIRRGYVEQIKACFPYDRPIFRLITSQLVLSVFRLQRNLNFLYHSGRTITIVDRTLVYFMAGIPHTIVRIISSKRSRQCEWFVESDQRMHFFNVCIALSLLVYPVDNTIGLIQTGIFFCGKIWGQV